MHTERQELSVHTGAKCALRAHFDWKTASGWSVEEDVGWSLEPGGCSFINQVGTVNENTDISPAHAFKDRIVLFLCEEQQDVPGIQHQRRLGKKKIK